ncbi:ABC transporter ATP-binding protein [Paenibacillus durus]|uniref:ABC transporter domain-containing protein n=1 Tax=Paenibacillus durus ATCC 35681 TaxID=1333534 RepID=A0A0F7CIU9_PAEDU|nr:ABC transporter ATP-binding protein [Paenibacillus durus]AKG35626.1 hypothetical protein VK70_14440 [Paenibacillus durus ATCC 35681]
MTCVLRTIALTKKYKNRTVIDHMNLNIRRGDIYGILAKGGAGKTTLLRMMMGLIAPTSGEVELFGETSHRAKRRLLERIGCMSETFGFADNLTAAEILEIHRRLMGVPGKECIADSLKIVGLSGIQNVRCYGLTLSMRQRLGIARALMHKPELLLLDEPWSGLDSQEIKEISRLLSRLSQTRQMTIVISSRLINGIQPIANRIGILQGATLAAELDHETLLQKSRRYMKFRVSDEKKAAVLLEQNMGIHDYKISEPGLVLVYEQLERSSAITRLLIEHDVDVIEASFNQGLIDDYMIELMRENI